MRIPLPYSFASVVLLYEKVHTKNLCCYSRHRVWHGDGMVYAAKIPARVTFADVDCVGLSVNFQKVAASARQIRR